MSFPIFLLSDSRSTRCGDRATNGFTEPDRYDLEKIFIAGKHQMRMTPFSVRSVRRQAAGLYVKRSWLDGSQ